MWIRVAYNSTMKSGTNTSWHEVAKWYNDKVGKMENQSRAEFLLFLAITARFDK